MKAVHQSHAASEGHPFQPTHSEQIGHRNDAHPRASGIAGRQITDLDDRRSVHAIVGAGTDQQLDCLVQVTLQK
ncbi:hypothetical protein D3C72_2361980 [compost metagenome]